MCMKLSLLSEDGPDETDVHNQYKPDEWRTKTQSSIKPVNRWQVKTQPAIKSKPPQDKPKQNLNWGPGGKLEIWLDDDEEKPKQKPAERDPHRYYAGFGMDDPTIKQFMATASDIYRETGKPVYIVDHGGRFQATIIKPRDHRKIIHVFGDQEYGKRRIRA